MTDDLIDTAHALADTARQATLAQFRRRDLTSDNKAAIGFDPVTEGDRAAEAAMRTVLAERRPEDGIFGEEYGETQGSSGLTWVLDPIDGTRGFLAGTPTWGVLIAVCDASGPIYGIIDQPFIGERFEGGLERAAYSGPMGPAALGVRTGKALKDAILFSTFPEVGTQREAELFHQVSARARLTRYGMDCYAYGLLALGHIDLVIEAGLQRYDIAAPVAVVQAAGGIVTNWHGGRVDFGGRAIAAATPELHAEALAILSNIEDAEGAA